MDEFWSVLGNYYNLTDESKNLLGKLMRKTTLQKNEIYLYEGDIPKNAAFIRQGLLSYFYSDQNGNKVIKRFFSENNFVASTSALINKSPSMFTIQALEETLIYQFNFNKFLDLVSSNHEIALFYIKYLEKNWITNKELQEITLKQQTAKQTLFRFS
jgi:CRP-like cAMP-binding protein